MAKQGMKKNASFHACEMEVDSKPEETPSVLQEISLTFGIVAKVQRVRFCLPFLILKCSEGVPRRLLSSTIGSRNPSSEAKTVSFGLDIEPETNLI